MTWDLDAIISRLYAKQLLPEHTVRELCEKVKEVLVREGNVRSVSPPCTLVGDVHGYVLLGSKKFAEKGVPIYHRN